MADAIRGNVAEVKLGQLAAERAQSQQVREYGDMLKKDHTKSLEKASSLASEIGVPASSELTAQQQKQFESLQKLSGDEFDTTFLSQMVREHQSEIAKFSAQAQSGSDPGGHGVREGHVTDAAGASTARAIDSVGLEERDTVRRAARRIP